MVTSSTYKMWVEMTDTEIWSKFRSGNPDALEYLYRTYAKDLYNYGMKIKANSCLVEDMIQELFLDLWNSRRNLASIQKIKFYLFKSLKCKIMYQVNRDNKLYGSQSCGTIEYKVILPFEHKFVNEQSLIAKKASLVKEMNKLPQRQKEVIELLFFENLTYEEIAELMDIRVRSVYVLGYRALSQLRKSLAAYKSQLLFFWGMFVIGLLKVFFLQYL